MRKIILTVSMLLCVSSIIAQQLNKITAGANGMYPSFVVFDPSAAPAFSKGKIAVSEGQSKGLAYPVTVQLKSTERDLAGNDHYRYQQTINGIPVELAVYAVHTSGNKVVAQNGKLIRDIPKDIPAAVLPENTALNIALKFVNAKSYKWQDEAEESFIKAEQENSQATFYPKGKLVLYSGEEDVIPSKLRPAFKFDIYASDPVSRQFVFVDAVNGAILGKRELLHTTNATGSANTGYSATRTITTDYTGSTYRLRETGRGNGIQTFNMRKGTNYSNIIDFTDADNTWNNKNTNLDQYATDAHWGAEKTYDYYLTKFGRNSIDNAGFAIKSYVHYSTNYFNAFWDGSRMTYGDGNATDNYKPLTALDVCGHEITHGLTSFTSDLAYSGEPGALNEGFSDIFGTAIEFYARYSKWDWLIGSDFYTLRSMSNPNAYSQPDTYKGTYWYSGSADYGGVHTNSGVLNFWYYLLSQGGSGVNDKGFAYNVTGLTINKAAAIAYRTNTVYLTPTSKYADARVASIQAAIDLYGKGSSAEIQTINAWNAVGVAAPPPPPACSDVFEPNESMAAAKTLLLNTDIAARIGTAADKDWYRFTTTSTASNLNVTLTNLPLDYDLRLYNSAGTLLAISQNEMTLDETITNNTSSAATYYLQVYGYAGATSSSCYTIRVTTSNTSLLTAEPVQGLISNNKSTTTELNTIAVYPNPAKNNLMVSVNSENTMRSELSMIDILGRVTMKQQVQLQKGNNNLDVNISRLSPGAYILKMNGLNSVKVQVIQ